MGKEATCTETGLTDGKKCEICKAITVEQTIVNKKNHDYVNFVCTICKNEKISEGLKYTLSSDKTHYIVSGIGSCDDTEIRIPNTYNDLPVTNIEAGAFADCTDIVSIDIPDSVIGIGEGILSNCTNIQKVTIPFVGQNLDGTGRNQFEVLFTGKIMSSTVGEIPKSLKSIVVNGGTIPYNGFKKCNLVTSIEIGKNVTEIDATAFDECYKLTQIIVDSNNTKFKSVDGNMYSKDGKTILRYAEGKSQQSFVLPSDVTSIGARAFYRCSNLKNMSLHYGITSIGEQAFYACGIKNIELPNSMTSIGKKAFYSSPVETILIPNSVTSIGEEAFYWSDLKSVTIPNSVTSIGKSAFYSCPYLKTVWMPDNVTTIGGSAFSSNKIDTVYISDIEKWVKVSFENQGSNPLSYAQNVYFNNKIITELTFSSNVTSIGSYAFYQLKGLKSLTIPSGVERIGSSAFANCTELSSVEIENGVTNINSYAFQGCTSIKNITIPNSVTTIGYGVLSECTGIEEITIPFSGRYADGTGETQFKWLFINYNNGTTTIPNSLTKVTIKGDVAPNAFLGCIRLTTVVVDGATTIGRSAFRDCYGLTSVTIGNSVTSIDEYAFEGCNKIAEVYNLSNLEVPISPHFDLYTSLEEKSKQVKTDDGFIFYVDEKENWLLGYYGNETAITLPETWQGETYRVIDYAFYGRDDLTSIKMSDGVVQVGSYAFEECTNLAFNNYDNAKYLGTSSNPYMVLVSAKSTDILSCTINANTKIIAPYAFENCKEITSITIPNGVTTIGWVVFDDCWNLTSIKIPKSVVTVGAYMVGFSSNGLLKIYCEAESKPDGWSSNCFVGVESNVVWGYKPEN